MTLSRRLPRNLSSLRPFSTSALASSTRTVPFIGDIVHSDESTTDFKARVSAFRRQLAEARKEARQKTSALSPPAGREKKSGIVKSILYGSLEGQIEEAEMEQSYSKVLARGKYVHAFELHHVKPDRVGDYVALVGEMYPAIAGDGENKCHLVGSWKTEIGDCETFGTGPRSCFLGAGVGLAG